MMNATTLKNAFSPERIFRKCHSATQKTKDTLLKWSGASTIHCLGDSHTEMLRYVASHYLWLHTRFEYQIVQGASAMGLANPKSKTNALVAFQNYLHTVPEKDTLLFLLGEVDCGFLIWYRAQKYGYSVQTQFERSLKNYTTFLDKTKQTRNSKSIIVCSTPLPTIEDDQEWGNVAELRKEVQVSIKERTALTLRYNARLRSHCDAEGYHFLDVEAETLDPQTQTIADKYKNPNRFDHHLNNKTVSQLITPKLKDYGYL